MIPAKFHLKHLIRFSGKDFFSIISKSETIVFYGSHITVDVGTEPRRPNKNY